MIILADQTLTTRLLHVHVASGSLRPLILADTLRRTAERRRHHVRLTTPTPPRADPTTFNVRPPDTAPATGADVLITPAPTEAAQIQLPTPNETGDLTTADPLAIRLAILETPHPEPLALTPERLEAATRRLTTWRTQVAEWATAPGRAMHRPSATEAENALATNLNTPAALALLDQVATTQDIPPGAKLETFIHTDLLLGLNLVAAIGTA